MAALIPSAGASGTGTMTLQSPNTNATQVITIPDVTGTMMVSSNMPAFSAYASATQSLSSATATKIQFNTKNFDTNTNFNTTNYRFTPTTAGYYQINAGVTVANTSGSGFYISIYKNGAVYLTNATSSSLNTYAIPSISSLIYLNGSTDYVEIYCYNATVGAITTAIGVFGSYDGCQFSGSMVRTA